MEKQSNDTLAGQIYKIAQEARERFPSAEHVAAIKVRDKGVFVAQISRAGVGLYKERERIEITRLRGIEITQLWGVPVFVDPLMPPGMIRLENAAGVTLAEYVTRP